jgi:hypothetical protein
MPPALPGSSIPTAALAPPVLGTEPKRPRRTRLRRFPYGTALVGLLFVTAMGGPTGTARDVFEPMQVRPVQVAPSDPTEPPTVVPRTSLQPLHRPF